MERKPKVLLTIVSVCAVVALGTGGWYYLNHRASGPQPTCYGPGALGLVSDSNTGGVQQFNFTVEEQFARTWSMVVVEILDAEGNAMSTRSSGWNVTVWDSSGALVAVYNIQSIAPTWTFGGATDAVSGENMLVTAPETTPLNSEDSLRILITDGCSETIETPF